MANLAVIEMERGLDTAGWEVTPQARSQQCAHAISENKGLRLISELLDLLQEPKPSFPRLAAIHKDARTRLLEATGRLRPMVVGNNLVNREIVFLHQPGDNGRRPQSRALPVSPGIHANLDTNADLIARPGEIRMITLFRNRQMLYSAIFIHGKMPGDESHAAQGVPLRLSILVHERVPFLVSEQAGKAMHRKQGVMRGSIGSRLLVVRAMHGDELGCHRAGGQPPCLVLGNELLLNSLQFTQRWTGCGRRSKHCQGSESEGAEGNAVLVHERDLLWFYS